jgi:SAM-dependent methyltransferase
MKTYGTIHRPACPVCEWTMTDQGHWRIPLATHAECVTVHGALTNQWPCLEATTRYDFDRCCRCGSVFLNPVPELQYHGDEEGAKNVAASSLEKYRSRFDWVSRWIPPEATHGPAKVIDVACGAGELLTLIRQKWPDVDTYGIDYCAPYMDHVVKSGHNALRMDLSRSESRANAYALENADLAVFSEAFEHQLDAAAVVRSILGWLRPGGRLCFSAQALGQPLPIRPAETIYIPEMSVGVMAMLFKVNVLDCYPEAGRFLVVFEKP